MVFASCYVIFGIILLTITAKTEGGRLHRHENKSLEYLDYPEQEMTDFPLGISEVFDDAKGVFMKVLGKMLAKKRLIGLDSGWYW